MSRFVSLRVAVFITVFCGCNSSPQPACRSAADCAACQDCVEGECVGDAGALNACGECAPAPEEECGDGVDNDCDGESDEGCSACDGVTCDQPPPAECSSTTQLRRYAATGTCVDGRCTYGSTLFDCASGCEDGACLGCANDCSSEGASECVDGELRTCGADADGCLRWSAFSPCPDGACAGATTCGVCADKPSEGVWAMFRMPPNAWRAEQYFRVSITSEHGIATAVDGWLGRTSAHFPYGTIVCEPAGWNCGWPFHYVPETVEVVEMSMEICDGSPPATVDECAATVAIWNGIFCPWSAEFVELRDCRTDSLCPVMPQ